MQTETDMEATENHLEQAKLVQHAGYIDLEHFYDVREKTAAGLLQFGDLFAVSLGRALAVANIDDSLKIMRYWLALCDQHLLLYKMYIAKEKAELCQPQN